MTVFGAYLRPRDRHASSSGLVELLGEFGFSPGAARVALTRLIRDARITLMDAGPALWHYVLEEDAAALAGLAAARRSAPDVLEIPWMIEELRVGLFAQSVGTAYRVSPERVQRAIEALAG